MKKNLLILFCLILVVAGTSLSVHGEKDPDCLKALKTKARSLKQYRSYKAAANVKKILGEIEKGLEKCGFSKKDAAPIKDLRIRIEREVDKLAKAKKRLKTRYYSGKMTGLLNELEKQEQTGTGDETVEPEPEQEEQQEDQGEQDEGEIKIDTSFPAGKFDTHEEKGDDSTAAVEGANTSDNKISVITAGDLKTGMDLLEKRVGYLTGTVTFYRYAFVFLIIAVFVLMGFMVLFVVLLKRHDRKARQLEHQMALIRKNEDYHFQ